MAPWTYGKNSSKVRNKIVKQPFHVGEKDNINGTARYQLFASR